MDMTSFFISICIPSYNRPKELERLLNSIDCRDDRGIQIVICEDQSPKREQIRSVAENFAQQSKFKVKYVENNENYGYDKNIRECLLKADGEYIIFMGDDDMFIPDELDKFIEFLFKNRHLGYILRSYRNINMDGKEENFIYYPELKFFKPGENTYIELYRKSVFISGFTFKRDYALPTVTSEFDGTLLYQLYILAEICLMYPAAYYNIPFTQSIDEGGEFYFGSSNAEKAFRTPGKLSIKGEIKFIGSFIEISRYIDKKYLLNSTTGILRDMSKYSYPIMASLRPQGLTIFIQYVRELKKLGLACTIYFYLYFIGLVVLGEKNCKGIIRSIKKIMGKTPRL